MNKAAEVAIPKTDQQTMPHPQNSILLNEVQFHYKQLRNISNHLGWNIQCRERFRILQSILSNESKRLYEENWSRVIQNIEIHRKNPEKFWKTIKRITGTKMDTPPPIFKR